MKFLEPMLEEIKTPHKPPDDQYTPPELDLIALYCTLVKILYINGRLEFIAPLAAIINPIREGRPIHETKIRNEHAYFCTIDQLMVYHTLPKPNNPIIYFAGDSHVLACAYQNVTFNGVEHTIKPLLVTGLKYWHLRAKSHFYPKYNFWAVIPTAPPGSNIVFMFGEIDCREGLVISVKKCRYKDLEEGIRFTISIYIEVLKELIEKYQYKIYIHPPPPVIDVTREIVKTFTSILKEYVMKTKGLIWLEFFDHLLTPDGLKLNPNFELDDTHMNPTYLPLVSNAFKDIETKH